MIEDNYEGFDAGEDKKEVPKEEPKVLDDDFLGELKVVDIPDSDDECYF